MTYPKFTLISHDLCPYVQRAAIALLEKGIPFERKNIDLANKPEWFLKLSPLGKVPLLIVDDETVLFESSVIAEYIDEMTGGDLLANESLDKARQRAWIEFASSVIASIGQLYNARDEVEFDDARVALANKWQTLEANLDDGPFFNGAEYSLVDAAFAPAFRYFDVIESLTDVSFFPQVKGVTAWRQAMADRITVQGAVGADYADRLLEFFSKRDSVIGRLANQALSGDERSAA